MVSLNFSLKKPHIEEVQTMQLSKGKRDKKINNGRQNTTHNTD